MKNIATILTMAGLLAGTAQAANVLQGNRELGVAGSIDFDTVDDTLIDLNFTYGYFTADYLELGARVGLTDSDSFTQWRLGAFTEYHFYSGQPMVPFIGASIDVAGTSAEVIRRTVVVAEMDDAEATDDPAAAIVTRTTVDEDNTGIVLGVSAGAKYFLNDDVAISSALNLEFATEDIFPTDDGVDSTNWDFELGLRFYF